MMKYAIQLMVVQVVALCLCHFNPLFAQSISSTFMTRFEGGDVEYAYGGTEAQDGNFVIGGTLGTGNNGPDACLIKMDRAGSPLWIRAYGGNNDENLKSVVATRDGGYVFAGDTRSFGSGVTDALLVKTDGNGTVVWARAIGGIGQDFGIDVDTTSDGGYITTGTTASLGAGGSDVFAAKFSTAGALQWGIVVGGADLDFCNGVLQTSDGGYLISGATNSFGAGGLDIYLIKLDALGNLDWTQTLGGTGPETGYKAASLSDGLVAVSGITNSFGAGGTDALLMKIDLSGNLIWTHTYGSAALDRAFNVFETHDQHLVATGEGTTNTFGSGDQQIFKTDALGNLIWARHYGTVVDEAGFGAGFPTRDRGILMTGWDDNDEDFLITKTDSNGLLPCNSAPIGMLEGTPTFATGTGGLTTTGLVVQNLTFPEGGISLTEIPYCSAVLPVEVMHFSGGYASGVVRLDWELEISEGPGMLIVERAPVGGDFEALGNWRFVDGQSSIGQHTDREPLAGQALYRLAMKDRDGQLSHSQTVRIDNHAHFAEVLVQQNGGFLQRFSDISWEPGKSGTWKLLGMNGKVLEQGQVFAEARQFSIDLQSQTRGIVVLQIAQGNQKWNRKLVLLD